jgi:hypothetical protein
LSGTAQRFEITPFFGYTSSGDIATTAISVRELQIAGSFTWGAEFDYFFSPHVGLEVSYAQQETGLKITTRSGTASPSNPTPDSSMVTGVGVILRF